MSAVKRQLQSAAPRGTCDEMAAQAAISGTRELRKKLMGSGWCAPPMVRTTRIKDAGRGTARWAAAGRTRLTRRAVL